MQGAASEVQPALAEWLWQGRIPRSAITLVVGDAGAGKSTLAVELAARLTRGELTGEPERALLALQEDDGPSVTVPRLMAAGADLTMIGLDGSPGSGWRFPRDLERLDARLTETGASLFVLDPLDASVPALASQSARSIMDDLAAIAHRHGTALVALHHLTKGGKTIAQRIGGGRAISAVARSILVLSKLDEIARVVLDQDEGLPRLALSHHKSSYGAEAPPLLWERLSLPHPVPGGDTVPRLVEIAELREADAEIVSGQRPQGWRRKVARALIERLLLGGPSTAEDLASDVLIVPEISRQTFERARGDLASEGVIEAYQEAGRWWWKLTFVVPDDLSVTPSNSTK
jgi:hypothetical protein